MKALQKTGPSYGLEIRDVDEPSAPDEGEVLIEVSACGICGSDIHVMEWTPNYEFMTSSLPVTLGHEFSGRISSSGPGTSLSKGTRVTVRPFSTCGRCDSCETGDFENCDAKSPYIGLRRNGGFAGLVTVPEWNCLPIPDNVPDEVAALTEPLSIGAQAIANGEVSSGDRVLVIGPGMIGQSIAMMARRAGASEVVIAGKGDQPRLATLQKLGFENAIDLGEDELSSISADFAPFDVIFEATGVPAVIDQGLALLRREGTLVISGIHPAKAEIDVTRLAREQQKLRGSHRAPRKIWLDMIDTLADSPELFLPMITHRLPLSDALEGFRLSRDREASKVLLLP